MLWDAFNLDVYLAEASRGAGFEECVGLVGICFKPCQDVACFLDYTGLNQKRYAVDVGRVRLT